MPTNIYRIALLTLSFLVSAAAGMAQSKTAGVKDRSALPTGEATKSKQPVATVAGQPIYDDDLTTRAQGQLLPVHHQEYEIKKRVLDSLIEEKLLEAEAKKKGVAKDKLLEQEVDAKVQEPTDAELAAYYLGQKDRLNRPFGEVKDQLRQALKQAKIQQARQEYLNGLRAGSDIVVLLSPPKVQVGYDLARLRGNPKAPVMIVEFSDFQCPYCRQVQPTLKQVLAKYADKVSLAYRDLPLAQLHPQAELAAEASRCALEQGKFWEYHDRLYETSNLDRAGLLDDARALNLDEKQFDSCLSAGKYKAEVARDLQEGMQVGATGTPAFFINGIPTSGSQPLDTFTRIIDEELTQKH